MCVWINWYGSPPQIWQTFIHLRTKTGIHHGTCGWKRKIQCTTCPIMSTTKPATLNGNGHPILKQGFYELGRMSTEVRFAFHLGVQLCTVYITFFFFFFFFSSSPRMVGMVYARRKQYQWQWKFKFCGKRAGESSHPSKTSFLLVHNKGIHSETHSLCIIFWYTVEKNSSQTCRCQTSFEPQTPGTLHWVHACSWHSRHGRSLTLNLLWVESNWRCYHRIPGKSLWLNTVVSPWHGDSICLWPCIALHYMVIMIQ